MPEDQRLKEDMEYAAQTRAREKGEMGFLQKYYHKGAFHQVGYLILQVGTMQLTVSQEDDLLSRDYTAATESAVDMTILPQVMQVRDFGKVSFGVSHRSLSELISISARGPSIPISPTKIPRQVDGEQVDNGLGCRLSLKVDQGSHNKGAGTVSFFSQGGCQELTPVQVGDRICAQTALMPIKTTLMVTADRAASVPHKATVDKQDKDQAQMLQIWEGLEVGEATLERITGTKDGRGDMMRSVELVDVRRENKIGGMIGNEMVAGTEMMSAEIGIVTGVEKKTETGDETTEIEETTEIGGGIRTRSGDGTRRTTGIGIGHGGGTTNLISAVLRCTIGLHAVNVMMPFSWPAHRCISCRLVLHDSGQSASV